MAAQTPRHPAIMEAQAQSDSLPDVNAPIPAPIITTKRLIIRSIHKTDAVAMQRYANDADVLRYTSLAFSYPYTLEHANNWVNMNLGYTVAVNFVICEVNAPGVAVGGIGFKPGQDLRSHTAEIGYWLGKDFWGRGYVTEALELFTSWTFESYIGKEGQRVRRAFAVVCAPNIGSMRCLEKCGYAKEGILIGHNEKYGEVMNEHLYGLTKLAWEKNRK